MRIILLTLVAVFSGTMPLLARSIALLKPSFTAPHGCPTQAMNQVSAALNRPDCKFVGGQLVNRSTHLRYNGDTKALNGMLADLAKCPGVMLTVQFTDKFREPGDWSLSSQPGNNQFIFQGLVNLQSERINLNELRIPEGKGPPLKSAAAAPADGYAKTGVPVADLGAPMTWSAEQNGLRLGMSIAADADWRIGKEVKVALWVRNPGAKDAKFENTRRNDPKPGIAQEFDTWAGGVSFLQFKHSGQLHGMTVGSHLPNPGTGKELGNPGAGSVSYEFEFLRA